MSEGNGEVRSKILEAQTGFTGLHPIDVPEWGVVVYLKGLTGKERDRQEKEYGDLRDATTENLRARVLVRCLLTHAGNRIFSDADADALGEKDAPILDDLFGQAMFYAGITKKQRDDTLKNLSAGQAGSGN